MDKMREKEHLIQVCPKCGSTKLKNIFLMSPLELAHPSTIKAREQFLKYPVAAPIVGWQPENPSIYICKNCNYNGICPEIEKDKIKKFREKLKKK